MSHQERRVQVNTNKKLSAPQCLMQSPVLLLLCGAPVGSVSNQLSVVGPRRRTLEVGQLAERPQCPQLRGHLALQPGSGGRRVAGGGKLGRSNGQPSQGLLPRFEAAFLGMVSGFAAFLAASLALQER